MQGAQASTAVINAPSRKLFRPMFRARWQNMQNIVNDSAFIDMIPEPYVTYYIAFIQQCLQWSRGFVPMLHRSDFFSTGIGYTVCEIFSRECMSGGYRIESGNPELKKLMEDWAKRDNLDGDFSRMFFNANAGGNCLLVLTPIENDICAGAYPIDRCFFQIGRSGQITHATILNRFSAGEDVYYTKETRLYMNGKPYYRVRLGKGTVVQSPIWNSASIKAVPKEIQSQWEYAYGNILPEKWYELPLQSIGVYNVPNKPLAAAIADLPGYSDSTLYTALDILYSIDYNYTQAQVDMYMGKSRALVPKQMGGASIDVRGRTVDGVSFAEAISETPLEEQFYTEIQTNGIDGKPIQPTLLQPDLRGEAHKYIRDADLELLASKVGLSSTTLANHLNDNTEKTAHQVDTEENATEKSVALKRKLAANAINKMLCDVAKFYGYDDKVEIAWGRSGTNSATENAALLADYNAGTMPLREYLKRRWTDLSEEEIERWALQVEKENKAKNPYDGLSENYQGLLNDNSEQTAELPSVGVGRSGSGDKGNGTQGIPEQNA